MPPIVIEQFNSITTQTLAAVPSMVIATGVIILTWLVAKGAGSISKMLIGKTEIRPSLRFLLQKVVKLVVWLVGLMIAAVIVFPDFTPGSMIAGLGIGSLAIGFAFKDVFENFMAGIFIMMRDKMRLGDIIEVEGITGTVEHISIRETHIRNFSGELNILPNAMLFQNPVEIWSDEPKRRFDVVIGVAYDTDLDHAAAVLRAAVESCDMVEQEKPIQVFADAFGASSVDFVVRWWADSSGPQAAANRDQVIRAIKAALDKAEIEIPFPYVTHTFKEDVPLASQAAA